jgi:microcystin-dependent protein
MEPLLGMIQLFGFDWAPNGWARCDGQLLAISENTALLSLLGTTYGGDGRTTFALPDLRGRAPIHDGGAPGLTPRSLGEVGGQEQVSLTNPNQLPPHTHGVQGSATAASKNPAGAVPAYNDQGSAYGAPDGTAMATNMTQPTGTSAPIDSMPPFLAMNYCIAVEGIYPTRP